MLDLTVAIPTFNGAQRLPLVLKHLQAQQNTEGIAWEILIVDNHSNDNTFDLVRELQKNWNYPFPLRYCFEAKQGLAFARYKAVEEANSEFVGFLDDDNLADPNWVAAACQFGQSHPQVGAYGSKIVGNFEVEPPKNFARIASFLAINDRGKTMKPYDKKGKMLPPGAGLVVRKRAWLENVPLQTRLVGRTTGQMLASEDVEALRHIQTGGWEIWYNPAMLVHHIIPRKRLEKAYLMNLCYGVGLASYPTRTIALSSWQKPIFLLAYFINDIRRILLHLLKYRKAVQTDPVAASEMQFLIGRLASPFYFLKNRDRTHQTSNNKRYLPS
ncbi:hormogonium polysaccharide biosynthesis glycosyltransferase HpsE [Geitlerinema sp. PCC 9228]|jgi:glycosyltransferase involved in cell wall biosynthesis|uniref:hormogonium polysaccharide biosynthesis glycosyltransferase HpsE n=1 Tax=Geitlerinema sp. PCC 9228 TaxID=111611 RepID=UPI001B8C6E40|nr:hormogonium polysaccharide biosynthesis glycosyltransferase HpsE [Geitlerinema sp. PCC 9228]